MTTHRARFLAIIILALSQAGCAAIFKGSTAKVDVLGPREAEFSWVGGASIRTHTRGDGTQYLDLSTDSTHHIAVRYSGASDTLTLRHRINGWWIAGDLFTSGVVGAGVDGLTQSWFDFDNAAIIYIPDSLSAAGGGTAGWYLADADRVVPDSLRDRRKLGLMVSLYLGASSPIVQVPILGNYLALGIGYRLHPDVELLAMSELHGCTQLTDYTGNARPNTAVCNMATQTVALEVRYFPLRWLYAVASAGWMFGSAGSTVHADEQPTFATGHYPGFDFSTPQLSAGIGVRLWNVVVVEYRRQFGLGRIAIDSASSGAARFGTLRYGVNLSF